MKSKSIIFLLLIAFVACKNEQKNDNLKVKVIPQDTVKVETPAPPPPPPAKKVDMGVNLDDKYFLVVTTNHVKSFADAWSKKYQQDGFNSKVIMRNEDGLYHVAVQSFKDFDLAKAALEELRKDEGFTNAWIMVKDK